MSQRRALLSVSDKGGIQELGKALVERGWELLSTGGTAKTLREAGLPVTRVSDVTGHAEMMDGRVKTLHPAIHAGLLARRDREDDLEALADHGYAPIDLVAVNLYPFRETIAGGDVPVGEAMEQVDIGGPTMIRAAAKSHKDVWVVVDPADYASVLDALDDPEDTDGLRRKLAAKVFRHISQYDSAIAEYLEDGVVDNDASDGTLARVGDSATDGSGPPLSFTSEWALIQTLRYGENPDQAAGFYGPAAVAGQGIAGLEQHHGKELSYNNILDLDGALLSLAPFAFSPLPVVVIVKHTTPCGLGISDTLERAYRKALATDPVSAFGSVLAMNRTVDAEAAEAMAPLFIECLAAPGFTAEAMEILTRKKNIRVLTFPTDAAGPEHVAVDLDSVDTWAAMDADARATALFLASHGRVPSARMVRSVHGGLLVQTPAIAPFLGIPHENWTSVTRRTPSEAEWNDLRFAWAAIFGVKSNAILIARGGATLGIGGGQTSRVDASHLAVQKAKHANLSLKESVLASDAFFPFRDGVDAVSKVGVRAIVQPGGSRRDAEVIAAADEHGMAMVFTGQRLFRH